VVTPVQDDARGIVAPADGLARFRLDRFDPSPAVARFVDRYWLSTWDLRDRPPYTQQVLAHPVVNVVLVDGRAVVNGPSTQMTSRTLAGAGRGLGIMFRPGGFRPLLGRSLSTIADQTRPAAEVLGEGIARLAAAVAGDGGPGPIVDALDRLLAALVPARPQACEETSAIVERVATDPSVVRVEALAGEAGLSVRQLQRRFADHVGLSPKAVIRRYRLFEAAERARRDDMVDWAALAAELHYSDQPHLVRDFRSTFGLPPEQYARACAAT
jgi:AraC-like DNA-binding protein